MAKKKKFTRKDLKPGEVLCSHCTAKCCRYFALPIDEPETIEDFQHIRWYMMHGRVSVFVEDGTWFLMVHADCQHLLEDHRCGVYHDRPTICREYSTDNCEFDDDACYDKLFETPEQIWEYAEALLPKHPARQKKSRRTNDVSLPILSGSLVAL